MSDLIKRFSVELNGAIVATCSTLEEAEKAIEFYSGFFGIYTIWDHEKNQPIFSDISI